MKSKRNRNRKDTGGTPVPERDHAPRVSKLLEIPSSALIGMPQIEISGNREAVVEGCQGILEYDENVVRLAAGKMSVRFLGRNLQIRVMTQESAIVEGFITSIDFTV